MLRFSFYLAEEATTPGLLDVQLVALLTKLQGMGKRVVVYCPDGARAMRLSTLLWEGAPTSFTPHSVEGEGLPPQNQPAFLTPRGGNPSGAEVLIRLLGSPELTEVETFADVIEFFGGLEAEKAAARKRWKLAKESGAECRFFAYKNGRWLLQQG